MVTNKAKGEVRDWGAAGLDGVAFSWIPEGGQRVEITPGQETGSKGPGAGATGRPSLEWLWEPREHGEESGVKRKRLPGLGPWHRCGLILGA